MTPKILLADNDASISETLGRVLELEHYTVVRAATGREAVTQCLAHAPDLVLLDVDMPGQTGWQALETLHRLARLVPIVIITAVPHQSKRAAQLGAAALWEKPPHLPQMLQALDDLLAESADSRHVRTTGRQSRIPSRPAGPEPQPICKGKTC